MSDQSPIWDQQPDEPARLYARFDAYRLAGPTRSIRAIYQVQNATKGHAPGCWYSDALAWNWKARAEAWDAFERERLRQQRAVDLDRQYATDASLAERAVALLDQMLDHVRPEFVTITELCRFAEFWIELRRSSLQTPALLALEEKMAQLQKVIGERSNSNS